MIVWQKLDQEDSHGHKQHDPLEYYAFESGMILRSCCDHAGGYSGLMAYLPKCKVINGQIVKQTGVPTDLQAILDLIDDAKGEGDAGVKAAQLDAVAAMIEAL